LGTNAQEKTLSEKKFAAVMEKKFPVMEKALLKEKSPLELVLRSAEASGLGSRAAAPTPKKRLY